MARFLRLDNTTIVNLDHVAIVDQSNGQIILRGSRQQSRNDLQGIKISPAAVDVLLGVTPTTDTTGPAGYLTMVGITEIDPFGWWAHDLVVNISELAVVILRGTNADVWVAGGDLLQIRNGDSLFALLQEVPLRSPHRPSIHTLGTPRQRGDVAL